ncbi:MAG: hydroxylamine reductase, partial [Synergistaceae bacterium]|nr:hydroxylamine reductase [Synergistaceae bacterium]
MFCFQCEQTAKCSGCTGNVGVCGKSAKVAETQDELTGALISLACKNSDKNIYDLIIDGLFTTITNVSFNEKTERELIDRIKSFGIHEPYDMNKIWNAQEDIRSLKSLILLGIRGMAAYAYHVNALGYQSEEVNKFFIKALSALGDDLGMNELLPFVIETGKVNLKCMELLDKANTETYGSPVPTKVPFTIEKGPFIVVTGHDLKDLEILLEQTEGRGINIYTHGEMLPAHAYPKLKQYKH